MKREGEMHEDMNEEKQGVAGCGQEAVLISHTN